MIIRISMKNFKAHSNIELNELPMIVVLVGRNNSGKSSILHAAALPRYGPTFGAAVPIGDPRQLVHHGMRNGSVEVAFKTPPITWSADFNIEGSWSGHRWQGKGTGADQERLRLSMFYLSAIRQPLPVFSYQQFVREVGPQGEQTWNIIHQLKAMDDPRFSVILDWAKRFGMGISALGTPTVSPGQGEIAPESYGHRANLVLHGSGTWSLLPILTQGVLCENDETLLIEEPEIHLHRESIDILWEFLGECAKRGIQTMCATHSIDLHASMNERVEERVIPKDSVMYLLSRSKDGKTAAERKEPSVFRNIRSVVKKELAGEGL